MAEKSRMIVILSPFERWKNNISKKYLQKKFKISVSHTTRKPRSNEKNGRDYFFITNKEFKGLIKKKSF